LRGFSAFFAFKGFCPVQRAKSLTAKVAKKDRRARKVYCEESMRIDFLIERAVLPRLGLVLLLLLEWVAPASAHNGPPFPIIENQKVGPCMISLWTHPDVGTGTFFVIVDPVPGSAIPGDLKIQIGVQPESGRLPEALYNAERDDTRGQVDYKTAVHFDRDEFWRVRLVMESSRGRGEVFSRVEATPVGFGRWDLLFFLLPFLAIALLWLRGMSRRRSRVKREAQPA
jgi:hypothetical protein